MKVVRARLGEDRVDLRVVELARLGLELLPVDGRLDRIDVQGLGGGPHLRQRGRPVAGVVGLHAQHQIGRAIHHQCVAAIFLHDAWDGVGFRLRLLCLRLRCEACKRCH